MKIKKSKVKRKIHYCVWVCILCWKYESTYNLSSGWPKKHIFTEKISSASRITLIYCETVWLLLEMVVLILHIFSQFQAPLRWTFNALPLRRKAYLSLGTPLLGKIGTESCKNTASFIDLWCFGKVGNQKFHPKKLHSR